MLAGDRSATRGQEADDEQGDGDQGDDDPRDHAGSVPCHPSVKRRARYLISVSSLNIGRYMEMITMPTITPTPSIMIGSTIDVSAWTEASTSSS